VRNPGVEHEYRQESNFYYLSGFEEPGAILLLVRSPANSRYILFVQERDPRSEAYEGARAGVEGAMALYKADTALYVDDLERLLLRFVPNDAMVYYTFGIDTGVDDIIKRTFTLDRSAGDQRMSDPAPLVAGLRLIKNGDDFRMGLQQAIDISARPIVKRSSPFTPGCTNTKSKPSLNMSTGNTDHRETRFHALSDQAPTAPFCTTAGTPGR